MAVAQPHPSRPRRWITPLFVLVVVAGTVAALATPASAGWTKIGNATTIHLGDANYVLTQSADITVPATGTLGQAAPYPSEISVPQAARVTDLDVTLQGVTSAAPADLDILLVGPGGQQVLLLSDVGTGNVANVDITLDDDAVTSLTSSSTITPGHYKPSNVDGLDTFDPPAPASNGNTLLSVFNGTSAAGVWKLFVMDDATNATHAISGWQLDFTLGTSLYPSSIGAAGEPAIADVNVGVQGVSTSDADGIHLLLVGPGGEQAYLWGDAGGHSSLTGVDVTFDDEAVSALPDENPIVGGSYRPAHYGVTSFPAPAPVPTGASSLAVFDGLSPNGIWQLFAFNDAGQGVAVVSGWSLDLTWSDTVAPTGTVSINGGAALTTSRNVALDLAASDPAPSSGLLMRFSNDGVTFPAFQPYTSMAPWALTGPDGTKTVYAQFSDGDGNVSPIVSDTISMDVNGPSAIRLNPKKNAKGVDPTTKVKIKASEPLMASSVTKKTVVLKRKGTSGTVKAKVTYNTTSRTIVLTPVRALRGGTKYVVTVTGVRDVYGHPWDESTKSGVQPLSYSFKTA